MFEQLEALDAQQHDELRFSPLSHFHFAQQLTTVPLALSEFSPASRDFPIVFTSDKQTGISALALLSLRKGENPFVAKDGSWNGDYLPAHLRRYPFILGESSEQGRYWVMIDRQAPHFAGEEGEPLFVGGQEPEGGIVSRAKTFLADFHKELERTRLFLQQLEAAGVLVERQFTVNRDGQQEVAVRGFRVVDEEALKALDDATLADWVRSGLMGLVIAHLRSLENANRVLRRQQPEPAAVE